MKIFLVRPELGKMFSESQLDRLRAVGELVLVDTIQSVEEIPGLLDGDEDRILAIDPDSCDWSVPNSVLDRIPNLKAIVLQTTSFSWVDGAHASSLGVPVMNNPGFSRVAVAEWAVMAALALARRLPLVIKSGWKLDFEAHRGFELRGKTAGVIGLGRIGKTVAENLSGLGMNVQYWSKSTRDERFSFVELAELLSTSDVIVMCIARNEETSGMLTDELLRSMKPTAVFVRTGFPPNHKLLLEMVKNGKLFGYAFDEDHSTFNECEGNVLASPPMGWLTNESVSTSAEQWVDTIVRATKGEFVNRVN